MRRKERELYDPWYRYEKERERMLYDPLYRIEKEMERRIYDYHYRQEQRLWEPWRNTNDFQERVQEWRRKDPIYPLYRETVTGFHSIQDLQDLTYYQNLMMIKQRLRNEKRRRDEEMRKILTDLCSAAGIKCVFE